MIIENFNLFSWCIGVAFGLLAGWLLTWTIYSAKMRKLTISLWSYKDDVWDSIFDWSNKELKNIETKDIFSPQGKIIYHNVILNFQGFIREEKLKLTKIKRDKCQK